MTRNEAIRELEMTDDPNIRGLLVRCRESKYYRRQPERMDGSIDSEPSDRLLIGKAQEQICARRASDREAAGEPRIRPLGPGVIFRGERF